MKTFAIATLGCKVNAYESESYVQGLVNLGYKEVTFKEKADIYVINTCAVTNTASAKSRQKIHQAKRLNEKALICVVGCFVQTSANPEVLGVDVVIGSTHKDELSTLLHKALISKEKHSYVEDVSKDMVFEDVAVDHFTHRTRAYLKIQDGCNQFCSYCIIPFARGRERSMPLDIVMDKAKHLVASGHREIVLTGIHTGRYGMDLGISLLILLQALDTIEGLDRIRISSIEMNEVSDELIMFIATHKKIARHLHIPIQSGSDAVLKRMNRPYDIAYMKDRMMYIRSKIKDISISSDLILGFPGESENEYLQTRVTLQDLQFSFLHVFPFSKRQGTKAEQFKEPISKEIKKIRCQEVSFYSKQQYNVYISSFVGKWVEVLFEYEKDGYMYGHSSEYVMVRVPYCKDCLNRMESVFISGIEDDVLWGEIGGDYEIINNV